MYRRAAIIVMLALAASLAGTAPAPAQSRATVRIAFPGEDGSLTPYTFANGYGLMTLVYDTLSWRDAGGVPRPWLARSVRRSADGRHIVVRLHGGARWQDGRPLTAADVVFTYRYMQTHFNPRFTPQLTQLAGVRATGRLAVVFTLRGPALGFEDLPLADVPILPRHLWADLAPGRLAPAGLPVGSGPYRLVRHLPGRSYRFEANPRYFRGRPAIDRIEVPVVTGSDVRLAGVQDDLYDMTTVAVVAGMPAATAVTMSYARATSYAGTMLAFDLTRPPFDRLEARRAVASALDLGEIAGSSTGPGAQIPADRGMLAPSSPWAASQVLHRANAAVARVAFSEQGIGTFTVAAAQEDHVRVETARRVVQQLRDAGARARLRLMPGPALDRALGANTTAAPTFDAAVVGSPALASYDPTFLRAVFGAGREGSLNNGGYRSARFEQLAGRVDRASTVAARRRAVQAELRGLARDVPVVPLYFGGVAFAYRPAAYDRWADVRGSGILDKQSFLPGTAARRGPAVGATDPADPGDEGQVSLVPFIIALVVILLAGFGIALRRGRGS